MRIIFKKFALFCLLGASGCQSLVVIETSPENADIFIDDKLIGKTPISLSKETLDSAKVEVGYMITVMPPSQNEIKVLLPKNSGNIKIKLDLERVDIATKPTTSDTGADLARETLARRKRLNQHSADFLAEQTKLLSGDAADEAVIKRLQTEHPNSGGAFFLDALNYYLKNETESADRALKKAITINSLDIDYQTVFSEMNAKPSSGGT